MLPLARCLLLCGVNFDTDRGIIPDFLQLIKLRRI